MKNTIEAVDAHYSLKGLSSRILTALCRAGKDPDKLTRDDLAGFEEFHIGGRDETRNLAGFAGVRENDIILDVGCGIGGPARTLADEFGCRVTGLDLTEEYTWAATMLSQRVGLDDRLEFIHGSALSMPFADAAFDLVWMQHVNMNIADKKQLYGEISRVLQPEGRLVLHEILAGDGRDLHFPVFWAEDSSLSVLVSPQELHDELTACGFKRRKWDDVSERSSRWFQSMVEKIAKHGPPPLGLGTIVGPDAPVKAVNVLRNLAEGRIAVVQAVYACQP